MLFSLMDGSFTLSPEIFFAASLSYKLVSRRIKTNYNYKYKNQIFHLLNHKNTLLELSRNVYLIFNYTKCNDYLCFWYPVLVNKNSKKRRRKKVCKTDGSNAPIAIERQWNRFFLRLSCSILVCYLWTLFLIKQKFSQHHKILRNWGWQ